MLMTTKESSAPKAEHAHAPTHKTTNEKPVEHPAKSAEHPAAAQADDLPPERVKEGVRPGILILIICLAVLLLGGFIFGILTLIKTGGGAYHTEEYQGNTYYIIDRDYRGEYDIQYKNFTDDELFDDYDYIIEPEYDDEDDDEIEGEIPEDTVKTEKCIEYSKDEDKCIIVSNDDDDDDIDDDDDDDDIDDDDDDDDIDDDGYSYYDDDDDDDDDWYGWYDDDDDLFYSPDIINVLDYETYKEFCDTWGYRQKYTDPTQRYAVLSYVDYGSTRIEARLSHVTIDDDTIVFYVWDKASGMRDNSNAAYMIVVPFKDDEVIDITYRSLVTQEEYEEIRGKGGEIYYPVVDKPIVYLYPEEETKVSVKLGSPELLTVSYPKYTDGWNVLAEPNGTLVDLNTNRELYSLYYESKAVEKPELTEGFVVKGEDSAKFLEEKLACLGLTEREAEEFIVYWLPKLEGNNYNLIRFETKEEIEKNMPLSVSPAPDAVIRVVMDYKALDEEIEVKEQVLETPARNGFVVVEWGGSELK